MCTGEYDFVKIQSNFSSFELRARKDRGKKEKTPFLAVVFKAESVV